MIKNTIRNRPPLASLLCAELCDAIVSKTSSLADARSLNKVFGANRDQATWRKATLSHLPNIAGCLPIPLQDELAREIQTSGSLTYDECSLWSELDLECLEDAAKVLNETDDERALKPRLLITTLERYKDNFEKLTCDEQTETDVDFDILHDALEQSLLDSAQALLKPEHLNSTLALTLHAASTSLPRILSGFDHIVRLELHRVGASIDLSVLQNMRNLKEVTLNLDSAMRPQIPKLAQDVKICIKEGRHAPPKSVLNVRSIGLFP